MFLERVLLNSEKNLENYIKIRVVNIHYYLKLERCIDAGVDDYASIVNAPLFFFKEFKINIYLMYILRTPYPKISETIKDVLHFF